MDVWSDDSGGERDDGLGSPEYNGLGSPGDNGVSVEERSYNSSEHINHDEEEEEEDDSDEEDHRRIHEYDSDEQPIKRIRTLRNQTLKKDRLGLLPDSVLSHILSFLPTKDAIKTGVLSRRWLYLWTSVPNLTFSYQGGWYPQSKFDNFLNFIDRTLVFHSSGLKKFLLEFRYKDSLNPRVSAWLRFATRANVEELCLDLAGRTGYPGGSYHRYVLPQQLYTNSTIVKLSLTLCDLTPNRVISWKALKSLSINTTTLSEYIIRKILAGSPLLDFLELHTFCGFNCLDLRESNLKKLVLNMYWKVNESELEIIAPKLRSLSILGQMQKKKLRLTNVQSVDECNLNFYQTADEEYYELSGKILIQVLERLNHVNKLTLGSHCTEVLSTMEKKGVFLPISRRKCLTLKTHLYRGDLPGIVSLLRSSPFLQTLHIDMTSFDDGEVLERMVISAQKVDGRRLQFRNTSRELLDVALKLLSCPRSSVQAVVELSE